MAYLANNPDVMDAYLRGDGGNMSAAELARYHYDTYGRWEGRSFAVGTNYVPYNMLAQIHEGERIIPAADNRDLFRVLNSRADSGSEIRLLQQEVRELRLMTRTLLDEIARNTGSTAASNAAIADGRAVQAVRQQGVVLTKEAVPGQ